MTRFVKRRPLAAVATVAAVALVAACGSDSPSTPSGTLRVGVAPPSLSVAAGASGTATATLTRGGSFTGAVSLAVNGAPAGITVTPSPAAVASGASTATLAVSVGAAVAPGRYPVRVVATGSGVPADSVTLTIGVVAAGAGSASITAAPASVTVTAGGAAVTSTLTIGRTAPFTGALNLAVNGLPANVSGTLSPTSVTGTSATLSLAAAAGVLNGTYPLEIRGTGTGISDAVATVQLTVTGGATPGASLAPSPASLAITAGGAAGTSTITITRTGGFTGPVNLTATPATGTPSGVTASITPNTGVTGSTATLTVNVAGGTAAGTYQIAVGVSGTGITTTSINVPVTVSSGSTGGTSIAYCAADAPIWAAQQDGSGAWQRVTPTSGSTYSFSFRSGRGGIATVDTSGTVFETTIVYLTSAELANFARSVNFGGCGSKTLNGSVAGLTGVTQSANVGLGFSSTTVSPPATTFTLTSVADGAQDLVATRATINLTTFAQVTDRIILRRGLNLASGGTIPLLDFGGAEAFAPATFNATVAGGAGGQTFLSNSYVGQSGSASATLAQLTGLTGFTGPQALQAIPLAQLQAGEFQQAQAFETTATGSRSVAVFYRALADRTLTFGATLNAPTVTNVATTPVVRPRVQLASQADYNGFLSLQFQQNRGNSVTVNASAGYFGGLPATWDITVPDLSGVTGWLTAWGLTTTPAYQWSVGAFGGASFFDAAYTDGATQRSAFRLSP